MQIKGTQNVPYRWTYYIGTINLSIYTDGHGESHFELWVVFFSIFMTIYRKQNCNVLIWNQMNTKGFPFGSSLLKWPLPLIQKGASQEGIYFLQYSHKAPQGRRTFYFSPKTIEDSSDLDMIYSEGESLKLGSQKILLLHWGWQGNDRTKTPVGNLNAAWPAAHWRWLLKVFKMCTISFI